MIASRILLIPVIAAVGYEILQVRGAPPREPGRQGAAVPGHPRPDDHDEAADRRHDRGRDRLDGGGARADGEAVPGGLDPLERDPIGAGPAKPAPATGVRQRPVTRAAAATPTPTDPPAGSRATLDAKLAEVARQYDDVQAELIAPRGRPRTRELRRLGKELARLEPVVEAFRRLKAVRAELAGAREMRDAGDGDEEIRAMAREEIEPARGRRGRDCSRSSRSCCCRATRTTTATSSWRSAPAPAARRPPCSPTSCSGCTSATPTTTSSVPT